MVYISTLGCVVFAQSAANVQVLPDTDKVIVGQTFRVRAVARDNLGNVLNVPWTFSSTNNSILTVLTDGQVLASGLGIARIRATAGGTFQETSIQVLPAKIDVTPKQADLSVGEKLKFTATIFDANGKAVAATIRWSVLTGVGFNSNAASINGSGELTALGEGDLLVRAYYSYGSYIPGFQNEVQVSVPISIRAPNSYNLQRVAPPAGSADGFPLRYRSTQIMAGDKGQLLFMTSLGGWAAGLTLWNGSELKMVAPLNQPGPVVASYVYDFFNFSMNRQGEIAATGAMIGSGNVLWRGDAANGLRPVLWDNMVASSYFVTSARTGRSPISEDGAVVFLANHRSIEDTSVYSGLFLMDRNGSSRPVASNAKVWDDLGGRPAFDADAFGAAPNGVVFFTASSGSQRAIYRQEGLSAPVRVIGTGDEFNGSRVSSFPSSALFWVSGEGDLIFAVTLANGQTRLVRAVDGVLSKAEHIQISSWGAVWGSRRDAGVLFGGTPTGKQWGLHTWKAGQWVTHYATGVSKAGSATIEAMMSGALDSDGKPVSIVQTSDNPWILARFDPEASGLAWAGMTMRERAPGAIWGFIPGNKSGDLLVTAAGQNGTIWRLNSRGFQPAATTGDRFSGTYVFTGGATWNSRRGDAEGALYTTQSNGWGITRISPAGNVTQAMPCNRRIEDDTQIYCPYEIRINSAGAMVHLQSTSRSDTRLVYTKSNQSKTVFTNGGNGNYLTHIANFGTVASWGEYVLDDEGRVLALLRNREGDFGMFVWQDGLWKPVARLGDTFGRWTAINFATLKTVGSKFYFRVQVPGGVWLLAEYEAGAPAVKVNIDDTGANGIQLLNIGSYDVNARGDVVFATSPFGQTTYQVKRGDQYFHVYSTRGLTEDNQLLWRLVDLDIRDNGELYFLFVTVADEPVVYRATPR